MSPVKSHKRPETALENRLRQACIVLGLGYALPLTAMAARAKMPPSTLKNAGARNSLSYELASKLAGLFDDVPQETILWLRGETGGRVPQRPKKASDSPMGASEPVLVGMTRQHGGGALARALERALQNDEMAGNRHALREFGQLIYRLATDLRTMGHAESAAEFFMLNNAIRDEIERLDRIATGDRTGT